jgi:hypothetical protein
MATANTQALARELLSANYDADDLPNLARKVYVSCLLKVHAVGGRANAAKSIALSVTGNVLKQLVGMHFTALDVQSLLDEQEGGSKPAEPRTTASLDPHDLGDAKADEPRKKVSLDPHDLGM